MSFMTFSCIDLMYFDHIQLPLSSFIPFTPHTFIEPLLVSNQSYTLMTGDCVRVCLCVSLSVLGMCASPNEFSLGLLWDLKW